MITVQKKSSKEKGYLEIDNSVNKIRVKSSSKDTIAEYHSIAELYRYWEDYEGPKDVWWLDNEGNVNYASRIENYYFEKNKQIGNYFETKEEAEKAVEKLKAWKRLKDEGFRFKTWYGGSKNIDWEITSLGDRAYIPRQICDDLDLLFGGEE